MTEIRQSRKVEYHKWKRLIESRTFNSHQFPVLHGSLITLDYLKLQGFNQPILVPTSAGLDMRMPPTKITIDDVRDLVGKDRVLDVLVVSDQSGTQMTLGEFQEYFDNPKRTRIYNVITLELAGTLLASMITRPKIVRDLDWTDVVWPRELKEKMDYPRVQLYCLMGVENSYTDFHIDFGGSSVFYHVIWGCKIFYMIPPTSTNLAKYSQWSSSPNQADVFFGDLVRECYKVVIQQGNTMLIPSGWVIRVELDSCCVYTKRHVSNWREFLAFVGYCRAISRSKNRSRHRSSI